LTISPLTFLPKANAHLGEGW